MKLTDKIVQLLNRNLETRLFLLDSSDVDAVQISKKWLKFHRASDDSTSVLFFKNLKSSVPKDGTLVSDGKKRFLVDGYGADESVFDGIRDALLAAVRETPDEITTIAGNLRDSLLLPLDLRGNAVSEFRTLKAESGGKAYVGKDHSGGTLLETPIAERARIISVGPKPKYGNIDFAFRIADLDRPGVPLHGIEKLLASPDKKLNESADGGVSADPAVRRLKLFKAAEREGAKIIDEKNWMAAVCYTYRQCHVFGRLKPKVVPGTNEIDPNCNLEDWEGITPENRAMRDDPSLPWVKDGITDLHGRVFDKLSGESGQPRKSFGCETAWCNCGVLNGDGSWEPRDRTNVYFEYYSNNGKTPYVILMDKDRGALYQYVRIRRPDGDIVNFLNEDDKIDGGRRGNPPDSEQMEFFALFCDVNPDFRELIKRLDSEYFS